MNPIAVRRTVMIVEDDPGVATLERRALERAGFIVVTAGTVEEATEELKKGLPDTLLLDYKLSGQQTGLDFYVRARDSGLAVPVIIVTGLGDHRTVIEALRAGVRDYVLKSPEYLAYLPTAVERVLKQDATERLLAESEARLAAAIGSSMDAILTFDMDGRILSFNPAAERMFGCGERQAIGAPLSRFIPGAFGSGASIAQPLSNPVHGPIEVTGLRVDRKELQLEAVFSDATAAGRHFYTVFLRDITERVQLEAQLRQVQKMDAIGRLAGGIAHDFNNLLTVIQGYGGIVREGVTDAMQKESMDELLKAVERAAILTRQLLAFSRKQTLRPVLLDLNHVVLETKLMLKRLIGENIELVADLAPDLGRIKADPGQMGQVILNLAVNARDAMAETGLLSIRTRNVELDVDAVTLLHEATPGPWVSLSVQDNGVGMDAATCARIFEPFFTTKETGKGTGLGLSTVYGIVKQSGGFITVLSAPGKGATFTVYLPRVAQEVAGVLSRATEP